MCPLFWQRAALTWTQQIPTTSSAALAAGAVWPTPVLHVAAAAGTSWIKSDVVQQPTSSQLCRFSLFSQFFNPAGPFPHAEKNMQQARLAPSQGNG